MPTFTILKEQIRQNLEAVDGIHIDATNLNDSVQDAYDDIVVLTQCQLKVATLSFQSTLTYYNLADDFGLTDYLATVAIFNNNTNEWLLDHKSLIDFDNIRFDWEIWEGTPQFWAPSDPKRIAIVPRYTTGTGNFDLHYWASAPTVVDSASPVFTPSFHKLIEYFVTADLLEQNEEFSKALIFWKLYWPLIESLKSKSHNIARNALIRLA